MYAQLGNIRFEGTKGFTTFEESFGVNYAQHDRINGKPRLESVGDILDSITFDMYLNSAFTNPEEDIEALRVAMVNREVLPLILGNGTVIGNFVIPSFTKSTSAADASGNIIEVTLSVELLEFYNDEPLRDAQRNAQNKAFATKARNSNVRSVLDPKLSPGMLVTHDISKIETSGKLVTQHVAEAEKNTATFEFYSGRINEQLDNMEGSIQDVQNQLSQAQELQNLATSLPGAMNDVYTRVQNMKAILPISDIASFKVFNNQLQASIFAAKTANIGLSNQSVIRRI